MTITLCAQFNVIGVMTMTPVIHITPKFMSLIWVIAGRVDPEPSPAAGPQAVLRLVAGWSGDWFRGQS